MRVIQFCYLVCRPLTLILLLASACAAPASALVSAAQLTTEYEAILTQARQALGLDATSRAVLTGWSRGAAFSVLVGSEPTARSE